MKISQFDSEKLLKVPVNAPVVEDAEQVPEPGDAVRTRKMQMDGRCEKVEGDLVYFRLEDGRLMKSPITNISVVEKLADGMAGGVVGGVAGAVATKSPGGAMAGYNIGSDIEDSITKEGYGGINRSAPAQDVSYEHVLDEVMQEWAELNELSLNKMRAYKDAATSDEAVRRRPLRKIAKSVDTVNNVSNKIKTRTGQTVPQDNSRGTYEDRLSGFLEAADFGDIVRKQGAPEKRRKVVDISYHGWTIKYKEASKPGERVEWVVINKKSEIVKTGTALTSKDAVGSAEEWIKAGGGTSLTASKGITIDYNIDWTKQFAPNGETYYIMFDIDNGSPIIYMSTEPQPGFKKTHIRQGNNQQSSPLSAAEANKLGIQPNGRYVFNDKIDIDNNTSAFPLVFQGISQSSTDKARLGAPGFIAAHSRGLEEDGLDEACWKDYKQVGMKEKGGKTVPNCVPKTDEAYEGPWQGDAAKLAKSPKSTMMGSKDVPFSKLVQDTIKQHGVKWAFEYYVKKNGLPPRQFRIFAGI
jgi:hypothetical protein